MFVDKHKIEKVNNFLLFILQILEINIELEQENSSERYIVSYQLFDRIEVLCDLIATGYSSWKPKQKKAKQKWTYRRATGMRWHYIF